MKHKLIHFLLIVSLLVSMLPAFSTEASATTSYIVGNNVTIPNSNVPVDGSNPYCQCGYAVGTGYHWCCWQYGYHVHYHIWGEYPDKRKESTHYLRNVDAADRTLTEENLKKYLLNAAPGALVRIDKRSSPTAGDNSGHTMVFVKMNATGDGAIFVEGNHDGKGRSQLYEWKFSELIDAYGPGSSANYQYIKYICWPDAPAYEEPPAFPYETECTAYPCGLELRITEDCAPWSLPCDGDTAAALGYSSVQLTELALSAGDTVTATALYCNSAGDLWYLITLPDGSSGYLFCGYTESIAPILPWLENGSFPTQIDGATPLTGTIQCYGIIETVQGQVYTGTSTWETLALTSNTATVNDDSYVLRSSSVDASLTFRSLEAYGPGYYTLTYAVDFYSYCADGNTLSTIPQSARVGCFPFHYGQEECAHLSCTAAVTEPTCTTGGYTTYTCDDCGYSYTDLATDPLGHSYAEGVCAICGEAEPVQTGDANSDGTVDFLDAMLVLQYYVGDIGADALKKSAADANGDGSVDFLDAMLILQYYVGDIDEL